MRTGRVASRGRVRARTVLTWVALGIVFALIPDRASPYVDATLSWLAYGATLFFVWCRTTQTVGLAGAAERLGLDYKLTGIGSFLLLGAGLAVGLVARQPRKGAVVVAAAATLTTFRMVVGDRETAGRERFRLRRPGLALVAAVGIAWYEVVELALRARGR